MDEALLSDDPEDEVLPDEVAAPTEVEVPTEVAAPERWLALTFQESLAWAREEAQTSFKSLNNQKSL